MLSALFLIKNLIEAWRISQYSRKEIVELRNRRLKETLLFAYEHSDFYRELWGQAGINAANLLTTPLARFPIVNKKQLMESFEKVVIKPGITKSDVEKFINEDPGGKKLYKNEYIALNTSGSSGYIGIFLFTKKFWRRQISALLARLRFTKISLFKKIRLAFTGEDTGHHAGASLVRSAPKLLFKTLSVSVGAPQKEINNAFDAFRPDVLTGYASSLSRLAEAQIAGDLRIKPELIISSGEPLTIARRESIRKAFDVSAFDLYGATECLAIGVDTSGTGVLEIFDDMLLVEAVDKNGNEVPAGKPGRILLTVFGNDIQPLIRYSLDDDIILYPEPTKPRLSQFTQAESVKGRSLEHLIFELPQGQLEIHPMELVGFFFPGLKHYQLRQTGPASAQLLVVAEGDREKILKQINSMLEVFLKEKGVAKKELDLSIEFVDAILPDPKTGKTPIIVPFKK